MAAVFIVSDSDECGLDEDGIGKSLSKEDWKRLVEKEWLTDKIILNYLELLKAHLQKSQLRVVILNGHFTSKYLKTGYSGVCHWYSKVDFLQADYVLTIFNDHGTHWTMMVIKPKEKQMVYYDSLSVTRTPYFSHMKSYFQQRLGLPQDTWDCKIAEGIPRQTNSSDCGVFLLEYARCLLLNQPMLFTQEMTVSIRHRMEQELRASQLHHCSTKLPSKSKTNPSIENDSNSDSDFDTEHHFKHPSPHILDEFDAAVASQLHHRSTKLPSKNKTNPSIENDSDSDSDFDTEHHFKHPSPHILDEFDAAVASQLHHCSTKLPSKNKTNPSIENDSDSDSDSDFDTEHHFKHPSPHILDEFDAANEPKFEVTPHAYKQWGELDHTLQSVLPPDYTYLVEHYQELPKASFSGAPKVCFQAHFRVNLQNEKQVKHWLHALQSHSKCTYRVTRTYKPLLKRVKYKVDMHCQHFQKKLTDKQVALARCSKRKPLSLVSNTRRKKTQCPSKLSITIQVPSKLQLKKYPAASKLAEHQAVIKLTFDHNHPLESAHVLSFRPVAPETKEKYLSLFNMGHSAASARHYYETLLLENEPDNAQQRLADRAVNPNPQDVSRLYNAWRQTQMGDDNGEGLFERLEHEIQMYNERWGEYGGKAKLQRFTVNDTDGEETEDEALPKAKRPKRERREPLILAICTPLMARAHATIPQAAEIMFCDCTSSLDRFNTSLFILSTCHPAGGIPLGILMTSDEKEETIQAALQMLEDVLPQNAFYGNGVQKGPAVVMTDDSMTEKGALKTMWPSSTQLLCIFHFLQRRWTWLWEGKNKIYKDDRAVLINLVKTLVYAPSEILLNQRYDEFKRNPTVLKYPHFLQHIESLYDRCHEWALCHRTDLPVRGNHTNNYSEASIGILKELIFSRIKAYNLVQMFQFATEALELYHQRKLLSVAHNRVDHYISVKYRGLIASKIPKEHIQQLPNDADQFLVKSKSDLDTTYLVDMALGTCSCPHGKDGSPCSHQGAIVLHFHHKALNFIPTMHASSRKQLAYIALGNTAEQSLDFYASLTQAEETQEIVHGSDMTSDGPDFSLPCWAVVREDAKDTSEMETKGKDSSNEEMGNDLEVKLEEVFQDLKSKLKENDPQINTGVQKFIDRYNTMKSNALLASALHQFGSMYAGVATSRQGGRLRRGPRIPIQASAAGRRKYGSRGKSAAPKGRPSIHCTSKPNTSSANRHMMPVRREPKGKRPHSLAANIRAGQQNAGKW